MKSFIDNVALDHVTIIVSGHEQDVEIRGDLAQVVHQHGTAHSWHHHVDQEKIRPVSETLKGLDRQVRTSRRSDFITFFCENRLKKTKDIRFVVHDQHDSASGSGALSFGTSGFLGTAQVLRNAQVGIPTQI